MPITRRRFLQGLAATAAAGPVLISSRAAGAQAAPQIVRHASIGASGMAWSDIQSFAKHPAFRLVAVADVDLARTDHVKQAFPEARLYQDWRELLRKERDNLDSINVSTPDHMHATVAMAAMRKGLHVYVQKPLAATVREVRQLTEYARGHHVLTQMGIQVSSMPSQRIPEAIVRNGSIGKVREVHTFCEKAWGDEQLIPEGADPVPSTLDWNGWLGVAAERPFKAGVYHPAEWRKRLGFGTGTLGDMACHIFSPPYRALGVTAPLTITSYGPAPNRDNWPLRSRVKYVFSGTPLTAGETIDFWWYDGDEHPPDSVMSLVGERMPKTGSVWIGTEGTLVLPHMDPPWFLLPAEKFETLHVPELPPRDHYAEFLDAVLTKQRTQPSAGFQYSGPLAEAVVLGTVAMHFPEQTLTWQAQSMKFKGHDDANDLLRRKPRKGWKQRGL
jgi:predicted dehydrogenase